MSTVNHFTEHEMTLFSKKKNNSYIWLLFTTSPKSQLTIQQKTSNEFTTELNRKLRSIRAEYRSDTYLPPLSLQAQTQSLTVHLCIPEKCWKPDNGITLQVESITYVSERARCRTMFNVVGIANWLLNTQNAIENFTFKGFWQTQVL
jgi:hypothetical protein